MFIVILGMPTNFRLCRKSRNLHFVTNFLFCVTQSELFEPADFASEFPGN